MNRHLTAPFSQLEDGERHPINEDTPVKPSYDRTWPFALAIWVYSLVRGGARGAAENDGHEATASSSTSSDEENEPETKATGVNGKQPAAAVKAGGARRRKARR